MTPTLGTQNAALSFALAEFATDRSLQLPDDARRVMRLSLYDWICVGRAGAQEPVSLLVRQWVSEDAGTPDAAVFGSAVRLPAKAAALSNGTTSHALDYDDTHFGHVGHPSVAVIPSALAIAEKVGASGKDFVDAALIGVEASCRIGAWLGRAHYQLGFHQTATAGCFGATLAACRLLGVSAEQTRHAMGIASSRASGLKSQFGTMGKPYNAGLAAANGVEAAELAAKGFVSEPEGLECAQGFGETHGGEMPPAGRVLDGLGTSFLFQSVQHKFHACCHGLHAALEALTEARDRHQLQPDRIESVTLTVNPRWLKVCNIPEPSTGLEAKFSYRLTAAMALTGRDTSALSTFSDATCKDNLLVRLRDRVHVIADDTVSDTQTHAVIECAGGESFKATYDLAQPLPIEMREERVRAKAAALLGAEPAATLWRRVVEVGECSNAVKSFGLVGGPVVPLEESVSGSGSMSGRRALAESGPEPEPDETT